MKLVDLKKYLGGQILYRSLVPSKKRRQSRFLGISDFSEKSKNITFQNIKKTTWSKQD